MDILSGIDSPFELQGKRQSLRFSGDDVGGQFQVELSANGCRTQVHGSWDRSDNSGYSQAGFYFDLSVVDHDPDKNLAMRLTRDDSGQGRLHIINPGQDEQVQISAPIGDLSRANSNCFEPDFFAYRSVTDVTIETDEEGIALAIYRECEPTPARFVFRDGCVLSES